MKKITVKRTRINGEVQKELSQILGNLKDPRIHKMTTVTAVEVTKDLHYGKIYISVLANEDEQKQTIQGLNQASAYIRRELAQSLNLRNTPELTFVLDQSIEYGVNMLKKIQEVNADLT
ncbi:ribosome-binding factor A [Clostridia bacterium]|nr:ribosome-binding factor A [Clostridia bacterium]